MWQNTEADSEIHATHCGIERLDRMAEGPAEVTAWEVHLRNSFMNGLRDEIRKEVCKLCVGWETAPMSTIEQYAIYSEKQLRTVSEKKRTRKENEAHQAALTMYQAVAGQRNRGRGQGRGHGRGREGYEQNNGQRDDRCCTSGKADLQDEPLENPDLVLWADGSASRDPETGKLQIGYAVVTAHRKQDAEVVAKALLTEIIPRWGIPNRISSHNSTPFVNQALDMLSKYYGINMCQHCAYHPASGRAVERENGTLKSKLAKTCQETSLAWTKALPLGLMSMRLVPNTKHRLSPYEILFGHPPNAGFGGMGAINQLEGAISDIMLSYCARLHVSLSQVQRHVKANHTLREPLIQRGDKVTDLRGE
ncbi:hypothetical protein P4O66_015126 [Electrophorus voltai]|uniref:Integrase catalytic domain-containing protein n=1 Tax=Electrophorus voltai TaxID=2609070 RepID=A0AAD9DQ98_9TELE|nr:hypothetical protein P4O66_015126 [Electrophorus voltai]